MKPENLDLVVRPRSSWEACDLSVLLVRRHFWPLFRIGLILSFPFFVFAHVVFIAWPDYLWLSSFLIWWSKPVWERIHLSVLSRAVFGEAPDLNTAVKEFRRTFFRQFIQSMTWRRLSLSRSFTLPVTQLEGLGGSARKKRISTLVGGDQPTIRWITIIGVHIESFLLIAAFLLVIFLVPSELSEGFWINVDRIDPMIMTILNNVLYYLIMMLVMPFYVAAGFTLYLNKRAILEGWDIEVSFRKLRNRMESQKNSDRPSIQLRGVLATAFLFVAMNFVPTSETHAQVLLPPAEIVTRDESSSLVSDILAGDDFHVIDEVQVPELNIEGWFEGDYSDNWLYRLLRFLSGSEREYDLTILEVILWVLVLGLILLIVMRYRLWAFEFAQSEPRKIDVELPTFLPADADDPLPENIPESAAQLASNGDLRAALALLYRGFLLRMIERHPIPIYSSSTEGECERLIAEHANNHSAEYFHSLSIAWKCLAYGHKAPGTAKVESLVDSWDEASRNPGPEVNV